MKARTLWLMALLLLSVLIASCATGPDPTETPRPTETIALREAVADQPASPSPSPSPCAVHFGNLSPSLKMNARRAAHTATLLPDGEVLIAGGFREEGTSEIPIASAELYDPESNSFRPAGNMNEARSGHTATLLPNGLVLIAGGWSLEGRTASTELYDPKTGDFRLAANMLGPRASMTATLLKNGQVLIAGGDSARNTPQFTAEIYDPDTNEFAPSGELNQGRSAHTATLLNDGTVLLVGGRPRYDDSNVLSSAELYDPASGEFALTGEANMPRYKHAAVLLQDGNVLVIGGSDQNDWSGQYVSAEIYDAGLDTFTQIADMNGERFKLANTALLLGNGDVLVGGGNRQVELFDAQGQRFIACDNIDDDYYFAAATLLQDGRALITGGYDSSIQPTEKAWIYDHS